MCLYGDLLTHVYVFSYFPFVNSSPNEIMQSKELKVIMKKITSISDRQQRKLNSNVKKNYILPYKKSFINKIGYIEEKNVKIKADKQVQ